MNVFGILIAVAGLVLFLSALLITLRANPRRRIAFWRSAEVIPAGSVPMRASGAGFLIVGAVLLSASGWWWPLLIVVAGPGVALIAITIHNSRSARVGDGRDS